MSATKLWISFHHQDEEIDHWALYLDTEIDRHCDIWQASGQTFEFEATHLRGMRPESVPNFKEQWLIKNSLTEAEVDAVKDIANNHPVDNEGAYWDCRIFCFEILGSLENRDVLSRTDEEYREVRRRLHEKWKTDDGVSARDSSDSEAEEEVVDVDADLTRVDESDLEEESKVDIPLSQDGINDETSVLASKKRAWSNSSSERFRAEYIKQDGDQAVPVIEANNIKRKRDQ